MQNNRLRSYFFIFALFFLSACGGGGGGSPSDNNLAPFITNSSTDFNVKENQTEAFTVIAGDPDGDAISFSLSGTDSSKLSINSSGDLSFISAPDYENPSDANTDNDYEFSVSIFDGSLTASEGFTITITDDPSDNPDTDPTCGVYIVDGDIAIQNAEQCDLMNLRLKYLLIGSQ